MVIIIVIGVTHLFLISLVTVLSNQFLYQEKKDNLQNVNSYSITFWRSVLRCW